MKLEEKIMQKLKEVVDPGTLSDVVGMGLIRNLNVTEEGEVSLELHPTSPVCPLVLPLALKIKKALKTLSEIKSLKLTVTEHQMAEEVNNYLKEEME